MHLSGRHLAEHIGLLLEVDTLQVDSGPEVVACINGVAAKLLLDTKNLVELSKTLGTSRSAGLDLSCAETDYDIGFGKLAHTP